MKTGISFLGFFLLLSFLHSAYAKREIPVTWNYYPSAAEVAVGDTIELIFEATIKPDWYIYSSDFDSSNFETDPGPMVTVFNFSPHPSYKLIGDLKPINARKKYDKYWKGEYTYFVRKGEFRQKVQILAENPQISGELTFASCTDIKNQCIPSSEEFTIQNIKVTQTPKPKKSLDLKILFAAVMVSLLLLIFIIIRLKKRGPSPK
jgi:hypothetical protein